MILRRRTYLAEEAITKKWLAGVKKWWKQWVAKSNQVGKLIGEKDHKRVLAYLDEGKRRLNRIKDNLDYKKGMALSTDSVTGNRKKDIKAPKYATPRVKVAYLFEDVFDALDNIRNRIAFQWSVIHDPKSAAYKLSTHGGPWDHDARRYGKSGKLNGYESLVEALPGDIKPLDKLMSGKLFRSLNTFISQWDMMGEPVEMGGDTETQASVGRMKIVFETGHRDPDWVAKHPDFYNAPNRNKQYIEHFQKAKALLAGAGFGKAWYGVAFIHPKGRAGARITAKTKQSFKEAGHWGWDDTIHLYQAPSKYVVETVVHEIAHRWYYKIMKQKERLAFDAYFDKVAAVSSYGGEKTAEDFAEVFTWYVLGRKLSRDQRERFKQFALKGGSVKRQESTMGLRRRSYLAEGLSKERPELLTKQQLASIKKAVATFCMGLNSCDYDVVYPDTDEWRRLDSQEKRILERGRMVYLRVGGGDGHEDYYWHVGIGARGKWKTIQERSPEGQVVRNGRKKRMTKERRAQVAARGKEQDAEFDRVMSMYRAAGIIGKK